MPRQSMTLSRHQDKLLQTPATLETLGSTSAVAHVAHVVKYWLSSLPPKVLATGSDTTIGSRYFGAIRLIARCAGVLLVPPCITFS